jgi:hypothetical protein
MDESRDHHTCQVVNLLTIQITQNINLLLFFQQRLATFSDVTRAALEVVVCGSTAGKPERLSEVEFVLRVICCENICARFWREDLIVACALCVQETIGVSIC